MKSKRLKAVEALMNEKQVRKEDAKNYKELRDNVAHRVAKHIFTHYLDFVNPNKPNFTAFKDVVYKMKAYHDAGKYQKNWFLYCYIYQRDVVEDGVES